MPTPLDQIRHDLKQAQNLINVALSQLDTLESSLELYDDEPSGNAFHDGVAPAFREAYEEIEKAAILSGQYKTPDLDAATDKPIHHKKQAPVPQIVPIAEPLIVNDEWKKVLDDLSNGTEHLFITGEAGTGKTTLEKLFTEKLQENYAILAFTGVAALRAGGMTINRFFGFGAHLLTADDIHTVSDSKREKFKALRVLIIDEVSMVRADVMDAINNFLRLNGPKPGTPFGGVRLILFGDLYQLPPVVSNNDEKKWMVHQYGVECAFFFHAACWRDVPLKTHTLTTVFRQKDATFVSLLNAMRHGEIKDDQLKAINARVDRNFRSPLGETWLTLVTTNNAAAVINEHALAQLPDPERCFNAIVSGDFDLKNAPTDEQLRLKIGAPVMFVRNDPHGRWHNGTIGRVTAITPWLEVTVNGAELVVETDKWEQYAYEFDVTTKKLKRMVNGTFQQVPLRVAAAVTIHKAQGLTIPNYILDLGSGAFAAGQGYVGFSRGTTLEGLVLRAPAKARDFIVDYEVVKFMRGEPIARPQGVLL